MFYCCSSCACHNAGIGCGPGCSSAMTMSKCACVCSMVKPAWTDTGGAPAGHRTTPPSSVHLRSSPTSSRASRPLSVEHDRPAIRQQGRPPHASGPMRALHIGLELRVHEGETGSDVLRCGSTRMCPRINSRHGPRHADTFQDTRCGVSMRVSELASPPPRLFDTGIRRTG